MSLPPDPHDDDLTGTYPEVGSRGPSGPPPPPPPPGGPIADDVTPLANAAAALGRDLGRAGATAEGEVPPYPPAGAPAADPGEDAPPSGGPSAPRRRGLLLAAVGVAVAVVVAGAIALSGGDDEPTASGDGDATVADAAPSDDAGSGDAPGGEATDGGSGGGADTGDGSEGAGASGGGLTDNRGESPVEAAEAMFAAAIAGDCEGVVARMTPRAYAPDGETAAEAVAECEADLDRNELFGAELRDVTAVSEDGDEAVVSVTLAIGGDTGTQDVPMVRLDDGWKVDVTQ